MFNFNSLHARLFGLPLSEDIQLLPPTQPDVMLQRDFPLDLPRSPGLDLTTKGSQPQLSQLHSDQGIAEVKERYKIKKRATPKQPPKQITTKPVLPERPPKPKACNPAPLPKPARVKPENQAPVKTPIKFTPYVKDEQLKAAAAPSAEGRFVIKIKIGKEENGKTLATKTSTPAKKYSVLPRIAQKPH